MIITEDGKLQVCCDTCPASYPNTYAQEDFGVMISDAKAAGWQIRKAMPSRDTDTSDLFASPARVAGKPKAQDYTHACPSCAAPNAEKGGLL